MKRLAEKFRETNDYTLLMITAYDLQVIAEEIQQQDW